MSAGIGARVSVGPRGAFAAKYLDADGEINIAVGRVGYDGIKANVEYVVTTDGRFVEQK
jgi:hypothetical protein